MINGWQIAKIDEVARQVERNETPIAGTNYRQIGVRLWGQGAYERQTIDGSQTRYAKLSRVENGDIVVNKIWARNGSVAVIPKELAGCFGSGEFPTFEPDRTKLDPRWFNWITKTKRFWDSCDEKSRGTSGKNRIRPERFLEIEIPLPPLAEQRRIVERIETTAARIAEAQALRRNIENEVNALLLSAYDSSFQLKDDWKVTKIADFCEKPQYGYTASAKFEPVGPRYLRITDIQDSKVDWERMPYCECQKPEKYLLSPKDILFARTGATTGKSFLIQECPESVFASYLIRLRVLRDVIPEYLYAYFQSPSYWSQIADEKKGTGQPNVNGQSLMNLQVPIPPPKEQLRIVAYLDDVQSRLTSLRQLQTATQKELDALLPSVLDRAFKGEL